MKTPKQVFGSLSEFAERWFPERQLYFRSNGEVHFLALSTRIQISLVLVFLAALTWVTVTSANFLMRDALLAGKEAKIQDMTASYGSLENEMSVLRADILTRAQELEERQRYLHQLIDQDPELSPAQLLPEMDDQAVEEGEMLQKESSLRIAPRPLFAGLISTAKAATLPGLMPSESTDQLRRRLALLNASQVDFAGRFRDLTRRRMERINEQIAPTKLKIDDLLALWSGNLQGVGGPFIPADGAQPSLALEADDPFLLLHEDWEKLQASYAALQSFPAGIPADDYYLSSRYGSRIDPFTKKRAKHYALDLAGWPGTPIRAGASGKVVKAGKWGAYGTMIEIDHGNGFRTRYGHMRKLTVKRGETVTTGQQIGEMGSTGRASSTHLHYEVWFAGKTRDPLPFIKVSDNVLKIQRRTKASH